MKILKYSVGQLQANCYFVVNGDECVIFDPGDSADFLLEEIQRMKLKPVALFATHGHFDHIMAVGEIQLSFNIPFYISKKDLFLVKRVGETAKYFLQNNPVVIPPKNFKDIKDGGFKIQNSKFKILRTPGHTPGATCFYFKEEGWLLTGDTLFKEAIGRYDFSYSSKEELKKSLSRLFKLPDETIIYPGHGQESLIDEEKRRGLV